MEDFQGIRLFCGALKFCLCRVDKKGKKNLDKFIKLNL